MNLEDLPAPHLPPGRPRLVVTGFMGTGKTTAGRLAAERLGMPFVDLDAAAEQRLGSTIAAAFREEGEERFREIERTLLREATALSATVVATGGGAAMASEFGGLARDAEVAVLTALTQDLEARLGDTTVRPLLAPDPAVRIQELLDARASAYSDAGEALQTTGRSPEEVADDLAERYRAHAGSDEAARVEVFGGDHGPVIVGEGALAGLGGEVADLAPEARIAAVVADPSAGPAIDSAAASLTQAGLRVAGIDLPPGEAAKTHDVLGRVWSELRSAGLDPTDVVVAVGGGAALDAAGLAAATYARGVELVNVPTTLLAMVDAGLGGKVAVDHAGAKNLVGTFHPPMLVVADPLTLATLPEADARAGLAEVAKAAVLASPLLLDALAEGSPSLTWVVEQAVRVKAGYVAADPFDQGLRRSLNLGHTFAHAIESVTGYAVRHGEAVAVGLVAAARLGARHGVTDGRVEERIRAVLRHLGLPTALPGSVDAGRLVEAMAADKKRRAGRAAFVVPASGGAALLDGVEPREAVECLLAAEAAP